MRLFSPFDHSCYSFLVQDLPTASSCLAMAWREWLGHSWELEGKSPSAPGWRSTGTLRRPSLKAPSPIQDAPGSKGGLNGHLLLKKAYVKHV